MNFIFKKYYKINFKNIYNFSYSRILDIWLFNKLIQNYINIYDWKLRRFTKFIIYLLNLFIIKYIVFYNIYVTASYSWYISYYLELFFWQKENFINFLFKEKNVMQKILLIKKVCVTRAKGRILRYKIIILIGNKSGWFGIGISKNTTLKEAILNARLNAFKHIYRLILLYSSKLKRKIYMHKDSKKIYIFISKSKIKFSNYYFFKVLFNLAGITNINSKIIGNHNISNILSLLLN